MVGRLANRTRCWRSTKCTAGSCLQPICLCLTSLAAGVSLNYKLDSGLNNAAILFPGCACAAVAIMLGGLAHIENQRFLKNKRRQELAEGSFGKASSSADLELVTGSATGAAFGAVKDPEAAVKTAGPDAAVPASGPALGLRDAEFLSIHSSQRCAGSSMNVPLLARQPTAWPDQQPIVVGCI